MPDDAGRDAAFYDHENEPRRHVADWGGDDLFTRMPRRRAVHTGPPPRFRRPPPIDLSHRPLPDSPGRFARSGDDDPGVDWTGPLVPRERDEPDPGVRAPRRRAGTDADRSATGAGPTGRFARAFGTDRDTGDPQDRAAWPSGAGRADRPSPADRADRADRPSREGRTQRPGGRTWDTAYRTDRFVAGAHEQVWHPDARAIDFEDALAPPRAAAADSWAEPSTAAAADSWKGPRAEAAGDSWTGPRAEAAGDSWTGPRAGAAADPWRGPRVATLHAVPPAIGSDNGFAPSGRRTVVIAGRPDGVARPPRERRRPPRTVAERVGPRPERIVAWAFVLGLLLILIAIATADAATL